MSEQLDNELKKRISEVFEHYEDTAPAHEGWKLLQQKFPQKKKRRMLPVWWSATAVFLLLCTFGLWIYNKPNTKQTVVMHRPEIKPTGTGNQPAVLPKKEAIAPQYDAGHALQQPASPGHTYAGHVNKNGEFHGLVLLPPVPATVPRADTGIAAPQSILQGNTYTGNAKPQGVGQQAVIASTAIITPPAVNQQPPVQTHINEAAQTAIVKKQAYPPAQPATGTVAEMMMADQSKIAQQSNDAKQPAAAKKDSLTGKKPLGMAAFLANEQKKEPVKEASKKEGKLLTDKKVLYNIYAATYFNYANGSSSQVNTGAGFGTDIKLSGHFKLSTGVAIGKNTLSYNGQPTQASIQRDANVVRDAAVQSAPNSQTAFLSVLAQPTAFAAVAGYNVSLTGLDVPVNIKYEFNPQKSDSYISAGLSSGTFINESYNYQYVNDLGSNYVSPDGTTRKSFTSFDFARTLNLSLGMGYQITKSNRLIIEPFVKYPLSGLGSQQIRFGASGINLRLKFQTKK